MASASPSPMTGAHPMSSSPQPRAPGLSTPEEPGHQASTTLAPGRERTNHSQYKRKWRKKAWHWMLTMALLGGVPGGQDSLPRQERTPHQDLIEHTVHRHRRETTRRQEPKGRSMRAWLYLIQALDQGSLQETLQRAQLNDIDVVMLQSTRWSSPGPGETHGFKVFYSSKR